MSDDPPAGVRPEASFERSVEIYAVHFVSWTFSFLAGFAALLWRRHA